MLAVESALNDWQAHAPPIKIPTLATTLLIITFWMERRSFDKKRSILFLNVVSFEHKTLRQTFLQFIDPFQLIFVEFLEIDICFSEDFIVEANLLSNKAFFSNWETINSHWGLNSYNMADKGQLVAQFI